MKNEWYGMHSLIPKEMFDKLDRTTQLELIAFHGMSGEEILESLNIIDESFEEEYKKLVYGDDE